LILSTSIQMFRKTGRNGLFLVVAALFLAGLFPAAALAQTQISNSLDPKILYQRMLDSRKIYDYEGILTYEQGGQMQSFEVSSTQQGAQLDQQLNQLDGPQQQHSMQFDVDCQPKQGASVEQFDEFYNFFAVGEVRVAGRTGTEIVLMPVDKYRNGYRFVIDNDSGLMLRSVVTAPDRRVVERTQFVNIEYQPRELDEADETDTDLGAEISPENDQVAAEEQIDVYEESENSELAETAEQSEEIAQHEESTVTPDTVGCNFFSIENGWVTGWLPAGFVMLQSTFEDERATLVYGDGISVVSVFIEPVLETFLPPSNAQRGATAIYINYLSTRTETYLVSVVGEVPMATAERVFSSLRRE
jgi:sigma-E factor negative regulatory protein RseB